MFSERKATARPAGTGLGSWIGGLCQHGLHLGVVCDFSVAPNGHHEHPVSPQRVGLHAVAVAFRDCAFYPAGIDCHPSGFDEEYSRSTHKSSLRGNLPINPDTCDAALGVLRTAPGVRNQTGRIFCRNSGTCFMRQRL